MDKSYRASLSQSQGRVGWSVSFRHPKRLDQNGKPGRKVRRGLGTSNRNEAERLVAEMNEILASPGLWSLASRTTAEKRFSPIIVDAFYENMAPPKPDYWGHREQIIPLPGKESGYARVLLVGTTGAGKTTIVRQLIGTDPKEERFPSISPAKTTISDHEIIISSESQYTAVVTFFTRDYILQHIEECVAAAVLAAANDGKEIEQKLLEHNAQRFRLSYLLGRTSLLSKQRIEDEEDEDETDSDDSDENEFTISETEKAALLNTLTSYITRVRQIANIQADSLRSQLDISIEGSSVEDQAAFYELLEEALQDDEAYGELVEDIINDVESRFSHLSKGELVKSETEWPSYWTFSTGDRTEFIQTIRTFSSNYAPSFGRLLTPLVEGIRVSGPFVPTWYDGDSPRIVILDGEGLGHVGGIDPSISTRITTRYSMADAILLVDNATAPMLTLPTAFMKSLVTSGHQDKLLICFTHYDGVKGDNLIGHDMRQTHVLNSFHNATAAIGRSLDSSAERALNGVVVRDRVFFVANAHKRITSAKQQHATNQLNSLISAIFQSVVPPAPLEISPLYDLNVLGPSIIKATQDFQGKWAGILNLRYDPSQKPEHWTRVKALTRRVIVGEDHYDNLQPVADLLQGLMGEIYSFIEDAEWGDGEVSTETREQAVNALRKAVFQVFIETIHQRLLDAQMDEWRSACSEGGRGSGRRRADKIMSIYSEAAPVPSGYDRRKHAEDFQVEVREKVGIVIQQAGGRIRQ